MVRRSAQGGRDRLAAVLAPSARDGRPWGTGSLTDPWRAGGPVVDDEPTLPLRVEPGGYGGSRRDASAGRWLPAAWRGARLDPGRPGALALLLVAAATAALAVVLVWQEAPRVEPVPGLPVVVEPTAAPPGPTPSAGPPESLVVAVAGRVVRPGLVRVPAGARVADVLEAAGGPLPGTDLAGVNLARRVSDGEQVAVGVPGAPDAAAPGGPGPGPGAPDAVLDLNTATVAQLDALPGVGPVTAERIVEWRTRNGRFATVEQLREVEGIGERRFGQLRELVRT
jgi:competence protein ComEA